MFQIFVHFTRTHAQHTGAHTARDRQTDVPEMVFAIFGIQIAPNTQAHTHTTHPLHPVHEMALNYVNCLAFINTPFQ